MGWSSCPWMSAAVVTGGENFGVIKGKNVGWRPGAAGSLLCARTMSCCGSMNRCTPRLLSGGWSQLQESNPAHQVFAQQMEIIVLHAAPIRIGQGITGVLSKVPFFYGVMTGGCRPRRPRTP